MQTADLDARTVAALGAALRSPAALPTPVFAKPSR